MPTLKHYWLVCPDDDKPDPEHYATEAEANAEANRLSLEHTHHFDTFSDSKWVESEEEKKSAKTLYLLTCEACNGEYGNVEHRTIHESVEGAKTLCATLVTPEDLKGEDAINEWHESKYHPGELKFRTGNWGFIVWEIRPLKLIP